MERAQHPKKEDIASRLINRIFRRSSRRTKSTASAAAVEAQPTIPEASASTAPAPPAQPSQQPQTSTAVVETTASPPVRDTTPVVPWTNVQQERARILFAKYGLTLEPNEWMTPRNLEVRRVDKPIRMRVRRTCHRCQTSFGPDKVCVNCQHVRCKQCPRYPPARTKEEKEARALAKAKAKAEASSEVAAADNSKQQQQQQNEPLTLPSRSGGQDVTYKDIKQRVRRTCHRCQTHFQGISTQCENCGHTRCKICPRDPAKLDKYPDGYPGDEDPPLERPIRVWKKPRMRVRYYCHKCDTAYIPGEPTCRNCGQEKGPETKRYPPKKEKPSVDPELLRRVQERLGVIRINEGDDT